MRTRRITKSGPPSLKSVPYAVQALERRVLLSAGTADTSFGINGFTTVGINPSSAYLTTYYDVARQADGKLVAVGRSYSAVGLDADSVLARFNPDGSLDKTFGNAGTVRADISAPTHGVDAARSVAIAADGKIVIAGDYVSSTVAGTLVYVARFTSSGALDSSFAAGGVLRLGAAGPTVPGINSSVSTAPVGLAIQTDGKIVVAGGGSFAVARINTNGTLDLAFDHDGLPNGVWSVPMPAYAQTTAVAIQPDGKIVAGGFIDASIGGATLGNAALVRFNSDGTLDTTFGAGGKQIGDGESITAIAIQSDGKIVTSNRGNWPRNADSIFDAFDLERRTSSGKLDSAFGQQGEVSVTLPAAGFGSTSIASDVAVDASGKILAAGYYYETDGVSSYPASVVVRLNSNGSADASFGTVAGYPGVAGVRGIAQPRAMLLQPDGKIVVVGNQSIARLNSDNNLLQASIAGNVFNDANANAVKDAAEAGLAGVRVYLDANKNGVFDAAEKSTLTNSAGAYSFTGLSAGSYRVREVVPVGYRQTLPTAVYYDLSLTAGQNSSGKNFGDTAKGLISGKVFNDSNGNGLQNTGEAGLSGWTVYLDINNNGRLDSGERSVLTDTAGNWKFDNLAAGKYIVRIVSKSGYRLIAPSNGVFSITVAAGQVAASRLFAEKKTP